MIAPTSTRHCSKKVQKAFARVCALTVMGDFLCAGVLSASAEKPAALLLLAAPVQSELL